ncbi:DUF2789 family protein [Pseudomonas typographi]|uniref:DUF2789 domain-containing protein n=1 Tax=Pseudomonas typographi TaxID=2715964 RepID=A0ABR7Z7L4_9PSED|nr:DUF2789 family protein [Pseudomonas typographi]MBD1554026.1 DUF2789 domain-containing protein [Pseudomonas typographi]MBD1589229.1 DUF2789 domain-containing protein [Pseudomonas typographi]MBD1601258.1 DUF2789 domain-containing protein [Pseudomonas typographi]
MELETRDLSTLFQQLGLDNTAEEIDLFIEQHQLQKDVKMTEADFWKPAQSDFLKQAIMADSPDALWVDELNVRLHANANADANTSADEKRSASR